LPFLVLRIIILPVLHLGHLIPVSWFIDLVNLHSGNLEQAKNFPNLLIFATNGAPHCGQISFVLSSSIKFIF